MRPLRIELRDFMAYHRASLDLEGQSLVALSGRNGSGKSTLLDAITWALYGKCVRGTSDDLIRRGANEMRVSLTFSLEGAEFTVARDRVRGDRSSCSFSTPDGRLTRRTMSETDEAIAATLGLPYETFLASCMVTQGRADEFTRLAPARRKEVLYDVLGLDQYARLEKRAREHLHSAEVEVLQLAGRIQQLESVTSRREEVLAMRSTAAAAVAALSAEQVTRQLNEMEATEARDQAAANDSTSRLLRSRVADARERLESDERRLSAKTREVAQLRGKIARASDIERAAARYSTLKSETAAAESMSAEMQSKVEQLREAFRTASAAEQELSAASTVLLRDVATAKRARDHLASSEVCDHCPFAADERRNAARHDELVREARRIEHALEQAREQTLAFAEEGRTQKDRAQTLTFRLSEMRSEMKKLEPDHESWLRLESTREYLIRATAEESILREAVATVKRLVCDLDRELAAHGDTEQILFAATAAVERAAAARLSTEQALRAAEGAYDLRDHELERIDASVAEQEALVARAREHDAAKQRWTYLVAALGKDGIPALVIENAVPAIEQVANEVLAGLPEQMKVRLVLRRPMKTADKMTDTLDIEVSGASTGSRYELLSGGEKDRVNLALRIALARVAASRYGARVRFLAVDEAFAQQDADSLAAMLEVIAAARVWFDLVVVVSHLPSVRDRFPAKVLVEKGASGSVAALVS